MKSIKRKMLRSNDISIETYYRRDWQITTDIITVANSQRAVILLVDDRWTSGLIGGSVQRKYVEERGLTATVYVQVAELRPIFHLKATSPLSPFAEL